MSRCTELSSDQTAFWECIEEENAAVRRLIDTAALSLDDVIGGGNLSWYGETGNAGDTITTPASGVTLSPLADIISQLGYLGDSVGDAAFYGDTGNLYLHGDGWWWDDAVSAAFEDAGYAPDIISIKVDPPARTTSHIDERPDVYKTSWKQKAYDRVFSPAKPSRTVPQKPNYLEPVVDWSGFTNQSPVKSPATGQATVMDDPLIDWSGFTKGVSDATESVTRPFMNTVDTVVGFVKEKPALTVILAGLAGLWIVS